MNHFALLICLFCITTAFGQSSLPLIRSNTSSIAIRDGQYYYTDSWSLAPDARPDVYTADRSRKPKWVVFYTDIDSIKTRVKPGSSFDFVILLNGKDSCFTRIQSAIPPEIKSKKPKITSDTIPFTLTDKNAIHVKAVVNDQDTLSLHLDLGSSDFRFTQEAIVKKTSLLAAQQKAMTAGAKPNFNQMAPVRKLQMGQMIWEDPKVRTTQLTAREMDGRFGWNLFEGKVLEINYDLGVLCIHTKMPKNKKDYQKSSLEFLQSFVCMKGTLLVKQKRYDGFFLLDTGSDQDLFLDSLWVARNAFPKDLPLLKTTVFSDPRGVKYESKTLLCPSFELNGFALSKVPANFMGRNPTGFEVNFLGNGVLKRFNALIDFKKDLIYLKPNRLFVLAFMDAKK